MSDDTRLQRIVDVLEKMDVDHDGSVEVEQVLKVFIIPIKIWYILVLCGII